MSVLSVSGLIEQQVQERPHAIAVDYPRHADGRDARLTYLELSRAANRLAAHLRARGVGRGDRVVTSLRPGPELVTAFLGIVRAGAAYVPVDPADPAERRRLIVRDSAAAVVLTESADAPDYADPHTAVVALDAEAPEIARRCDALPEQTTGPDDAVYVCYTSGTTGTPKGVVVPHRAVLDFVTSTDYLRLTPPTWWPRPPAPPSTRSPSRCGRRSPRAPGWSASARPPSTTRTASRTRSAPTASPCSS